MSKSTNDPDDDGAAFAAFTQNLSRTPVSAVSRSAVKRRSNRAWPTLIVSSLVIGGFTTAGALAAHGYGLADGFKIAAAALIGGPFGACAAMAGAMLLVLRLFNRSVTDLGETGTYRDMPPELLPLVWGAGYLGAIAGSAFFAGVAVHLATKSPDTQFLFGPPAIGGAIGAALCALVVGGIALLNATSAPRKDDQVQER